MLKGYQVVSEVLDEFSSSLGPCFIRINHSRILESIVRRLSCPPPCVCVRAVSVFFVCASRTSQPDTQAELSELSDRKKRNKIFTLIGQYSKYNWHHLARELLSENLSSKSMEAIKHFVHTRGA